MNHATPLLRWPAALLASSLVLLSACGGGGESSLSAPPTVVVPPVVAPPEEVEVTGPGELKEATLVGTFSLYDIAAAVEAPDNKLYQARPRYAVTSYRLTYVTKDGAGRNVIASGLVSVPIKARGTRSPVISYQHHGLALREAEAPSNNVVASEPPAVLASLGYIVVATDYVGFGASRGVHHPYLMSAATASAVVDLLTAARTWRRRNSVADNGQLFLAGYSEGGYATMAAHRALQAASSPHLAQLVLSVPGGGAYAMRPAIDGLFEYFDDMSNYLGSNLYGEVYMRLAYALIPRTDENLPLYFGAITSYLANDYDSLERNNNVHDWTPALPVHMFHGRDDRNRPYAAAARTLQVMQARGATKVTVTDCDATPSSHLGCVQPYFTYMLGEISAVARDL
jgi:pimeloyl-ACP methyl ester carboxylesterase